MTKSALASKKNKSNLSSTTSLKKKMKAEQKLNPFEIRFTKAKHNVINRPVQTEAGKPGITRAIGIKKRKETLLQEYKLKNKTNVFLDKRIGEKVSLALCVDGVGLVVQECGCLFMECGILRLSCKTSHDNTRRDQMGQTINGKVPSRFCDFLHMKWRTADTPCVIFFFQDSKLSAEDKMIARVTAERLKNHGKKSIFNLGGEETLTHFGQSLAEIERLDDDPRSDEEEDEESKRLNGKS